MSMTYHPSWFSLNLIFFALFLNPLLLAGAIFVAERNCSVTPFALPFANVSVLSDPDISSAHRGLQLSVGSGQKRISINVATTMNTTFLPDGHKVCNITAPDARACIFWRGGLFAPETSMSWQLDKKNVPYNGSASNEGYYATHQRDYHGGPGSDSLNEFQRGWDEVEFVAGVGGDDKFLAGYALTVIDDPSFPFGAGMIGLASDSRFLEIAVAAGVSPSHTWALDYGTTGSYSPGELVVGGYNSEKAKPEDFRNYTISTDPSIPCPLQVDVKSIKLGNLKLNMNSFPACIEPSMWTMILPLEVQKNFNNTVLYGSDIEFIRTTWEYTYYRSSSGDFPKENISIELKDGLIVTIPNNEVFDAAKNISSIGGWEFIKNTQQATIGSGGYASGEEPLVQLGSPFLSQVYLAVDYEAQTFHLAPMNRPADGGTTTKLERLGCSDTLSKVSNISQRKLRIIIVGVVGGFGVLAIIVGLAIFFYKKKNKTQVVQSGANRGGHKIECGGKAVQKNMASLLPGNEVFEASGKMLRNPTELPNPISGSSNTRRI